MPSLPRCHMLDELVARYFALLRHGHYGTSILHVPDFVTIVDAKNRRIPMLIIMQNTFALFAFTHLTFRRSGG
ncbi:MAG TPA: hypothetical protein VHQ22_04185 [Terriglobales bacterium]|nr:hypothetical protein [Terriglobales bacterium]